MINTKKLLSILLVSCLITLIFLLPVASANVTIKENTYKKQLAEIMRFYAQDPKNTIIRLAEIDTEIVSEPVTINHKEKTTLKKTTPTDYSLTIYATKKTNSDIYYLQWYLIANKKRMASRLH